MSDPAKLIEIKPTLTPDPEVILALENMLKDARAGTLRKVMIVGIKDYPGEPNCSVTAFAGKAPVAPMVMALEGAKLRLMGFTERDDFAEGALK